MSTIIPHAGYQPKSVLCDLVTSDEVMGHIDHIDTRTVLGTPEVRQILHLRKDCSICRARQPCLELEGREAGVDVDDAGVIRPLDTV